MSSGPVLIARSDRFVVAIRHVLAFPAGVEVEVEAHGRGAPQGSEDLTSYPQLRFRLSLADGREAAQDDEAGLRNGLGPMLSVTGSERSSGGPNDDEHIRMSVDLAATSARAGHRDVLMAGPRASGRWACP
jgi:hypothetical protein